MIEEIILFYFVLVLKNFLEINSKSIVHNI